MVVIIVGILAAIAVPIFLAQKNSASYEAAAQSDLRNGAAAATACSSDHQGSFATCDEETLTGTYDWNQTTGVESEVLPPKQTAGSPGRNTAREDAPSSSTRTKGGSRPWPPGSDPRTPNAHPGSPLQRGKSLLTEGDSRPERHLSSSPFPTPSRGAGLISGPRAHAASRYSWQREAGRRR